MNVLNKPPPCHSSIVSPFPFQLQTVLFLAQNKVAHRDIKPDNILIDPQILRIRLIDFGLSSILASEDDADTHCVGTPLYMSPSLLSQSKENPSPSFIVASDLWSVGMTALECLLGQHPFQSAPSKKELLGQLRKGFGFVKILNPALNSLLFLLLDANSPKRLRLADLSLFMLSLPSAESPPPKRISNHVRRRSSQMFSDRKGSI